MDKKIFHTKAEVVIKEDGKEEGVVEGVVGSTQVIDRMGEVINQDGWELANFKKNPVVLWGHNVRSERPPIGKALKVWIEGIRKKQLMFNIKFDLEDDFASEIFRKVKEKFVNTVSVGFLPLESEALEKDDSSFFAPQRYLKQELLELSFVPVPANPEALAALKGMGIEPVELEDLYPEPSMNIIEYEDKGIAPITEGWDGPGEVTKASIRSLEIMAAWDRHEYTPVDKSDYKFIHHRAEDHKAIWRGVCSAMALLLGAKGGVDIPKEDLPGVYEHLAKHYHEFEKEPPEYKMVEDQTLKGLEEELNAISLEREEKHQVRLIKKVIKQRKVASPTEREMIAALNLIKASLLKGGEKDG